MFLSIVLPAFNVEGYISRTLASLAAQSDLNFEVIVINDGSTDGTVRQVQRFIDEELLHNCRIISKENAGVSSARNVGIHEASGDYILFLDGDDFVDAKLVETLSEAALKEPDIICWKWLSVNENNQLTLDYYHKIGSVPPAEMAGVTVLEKILIEGNMHIWTASAIYRRELLISNLVTYTDGCVNGEDQEFTFKALSCAENVYFINKVLSFYLQRYNSITYTYNIKKFDVANAFKRAADFMNDKEDLQKVKEILLTRYRLNHYFHTIKSCMLSKSSTNSVRQLLREVDVHYPGLNAEMLGLMKTNKVGISLLKLKTIAFVIAPEVLQLFYECGNIASIIRKKIQQETI